MDNLDFENIADDLSIGDFINAPIENIKQIIADAEIAQLTSALASLYQDLIAFCTVNNLKLQNYPSKTTANIYFSQFLQYLFHSILKLNVDTVNKKTMLTDILNYPHDLFYYHFYVNGQKEIVFWVEPVTGDTSLTSVCQKSDVTILNKLLECLKKKFTKEADGVVSKLLENYLFHENKLGRSALSLIWLRQDTSLEASLFEFASFYYEDIFSESFQKFLFQIDSQGSTALMRSAKRSLGRLFPTILNNIARIYFGENSLGFQRLLLHLNNEGKSILIKLIQTQQRSRLDQLLNLAVVAFSGIKTPGFRRFLLLDTYPKITPLIEAVKTKDKNILDKLVRFTSDNFKENIVISDLLSQQDAEGYTALMHTIKNNYFEGFNYCLNVLMNINWEVQGYDYQNILKVLYLRSFQSEFRPGISVFQLAAKTSNWKMFEALIDSLRIVSSGNIKLTLTEMSYVDETGINTLTKLYREEREFRLQRSTGRRVSTKERNASARRLRLAKLLTKLGERSSERSVVPQWVSLEIEDESSSDSETRIRTIGERTLNFFGIFCGSFNYRGKRAIENNCFFPDSDYKVSIPENLLQRPKEALINLVAILKQTNLNSIHQISIIRNTAIISKRESELLDEFSKVVTRYYDAYGKFILGKLKKNTAETLEAAFAVNKPYVLLDNRKDLVLLSKNKIFCGSLLNPTKIFSLDPTLTHTELKGWLDRYFDSSYTLHPFDPALVQTYPDVLAELDEPILSDSAVLDSNFEGVKCQILREFYLLDGKPIEIAKFTHKSLFTVNKTDLSFRVERFHEVFFKLNSSEQRSLLLFIAAHKIPAANYAKLSEAENGYLTVYGNKLIDRIAQTDNISPLKLFEIAIETHEQILAEESGLSLGEKNQIFSELRTLKSKLATSESGAHTKAVLQLFVFLVPSVVRAIAKKDLLELAQPLGLIAADVALREVLIKLVNHPKVTQIFAAGLASKVLDVLGQVADRMPIIGSVLAVYGLVQSGKALINTNSQDPNRPYYAHLLANNLITVGAIGAGAAVSLPFWPVLGLFSLLTVDQVVTEGGRIHEVELHLQDDAGHPLLRFYRKLELGLSIVDADIQVVLEQRQLFDGFLSYLDQVRNIKGADALVAVALSSVKRISVPKTAQSGKVGCTNSHTRKQNPVYPQSPFCTTSHLIVDEGNYSYELGGLKTFCEKRDPFTVTHDSNYTLLVGSQSVDCSLGQSKTINAIAKADGNNIAGILVNSRFRNSNSSNAYRLFLPVDPSYVKNYQFKLLADTVSQPNSENTGIEQWLPCINGGTVHCINQIRVAVTSLYDRLSSHSMTQINISDDGLRATKPGVQTIEYLLAITDNVHIEPNKIPEKILAFFNEDHYLKFEGNLIKSENGFQAVLTAKRLTLEFTDKAYIEGFYQPPEDQQLVINQLKGLNEAKVAILDVARAPSFSINLGKNVQLIEQDFEISLHGNFNNSALEVYRHAKNETSFYQFLKPIEKIKVHPQGALLSLSILDSELNENLLVNIKSPTNSSNKVLKFTGTHTLKGHICFARIIMYKLPDLNWECDLEINAGMINNTQLLDVDALQSQNFNKVTVLIKNLQSYKKIHYLFYQNRELPNIEGKFITYHLIGSGTGWVVILNHEVPNEETRCFVGENTREIIINAIRYALRPELALLFAINAIDGSPINGYNLIAPLKIESSFSLKNFSLQNYTYSLENITFENLPPKTKIYFSDQVLPFAYLKYGLELNQSQTIVSEIAGNSLDGRQFVDIKPVTKSLVQSSGHSLINRFFFSMVVATTTLVGAAFFAFTRRFKRPAPPITSLAMPLMGEAEASTTLDEQRLLTEDLLELYASSNPKFGTSRNENRLKSIAANNVLPNAANSSIENNCDINSQLVFTRYMFHYAKKYKAKESKAKQISTDKYFYVAVNEERSINAISNVTGLLSK